MSRGRSPGTGTSRLALDEQIDVRALHQRGRQAVLHRPVRRRGSTSDGFEVRNYGFPPGAGRGTCSADAAREFNEDDPGEADGCITHDDDFLQYYLGAYIYVAGGNSTDEDRAACSPMVGVAGSPFERAAAGRFDGDRRATTRTTRPTFVVTSSILRSGEYPLYARLAERWRLAAPGAAPFSPFSGTQYMAAGADRRGVQAAAQDDRPHGRDAAPS